MGKYKDGKSCFLTFWYKLKLKKELLPWSTPSKPRFPLTILYKSSNSTPAFPHQRTDKYRRLFPYLLFTASTMQSFLSLSSVTEYK
jgi:hypothetical protein